jgi:hydroxyacylglutathione hydrolase
MHVNRLPAFDDNYLWGLRSASGEGRATVVDPGDPQVIEHWLDQSGAQLEAILVTHHHEDHVGGVAYLKQKYQCRVIGPAYETRLTALLTEFVSENDPVQLEAGRATVLEVHGHTSSHIAYWFEQDDALFCGDSLFVLGCGRMFEGTPAQMWGSMQKMRTLPDATLVYCAHEYSQSNARFALSVDPDNKDLRTVSEQINELRRQGKPTVPSSLGVEKKTNPFLRADMLAAQAFPALANAPGHEQFAAMRTAKDNFK